MLMTALALLATAATGAPAASRPMATGPITADYHAARGTLCIRSGWNTASFQTARLVRRGECRTASDWNRRNLTFDTAPVQQPRRAPDQVAAR